MSLYKNNGTISNCTQNVTEPFSVCNESIDIPISSSCKITNVTIAVKKRNQTSMIYRNAKLWLCEVEIFTGTEFYFRNVKELILSFFPKCSILFNKKYLKLLGYHLSYLRLSHLFLFIKTDELHLRKYAFCKCFWYKSYLARKI